METKSEMTKQERSALIRKMIVRFSFVPLFIGLCTLLPAGTFNYWQVCVYFSVLVVPMIFVLFYFLKRDPKFLERRTKGTEKVKEQKLIQLINLPVFMAAFIIPGLDRRFGWSEIPVEAVIATDAVILSGYIIIFLVFRQNSYASRIIEIDEEQKVLKENLAGYKEYCEKTRYRLIPSIW